MSAEVVDYKCCLLKILEWFHAFCTKFGLRYYLVEGSMLGAARHKGFIPWDDDIDVGMPRSDYERLKMLMGPNIQDNKYLLETEDSSRKEYLYPFGKLYDTTTTIIELRRLPVRMGVYIDIFPLDGIGETEEESYKNFKAIGIMQDILASRSVVVRKGRKWYKNLSVYTLQCLPSFIINEKKLLSRIKTLCKKRSFDDSVYVGNLVSTYRAREIMPKKFYGQPTLYNFENLEVYGVQDYDSYLTKLYKDWRKFPPEEKRTSAHVRNFLDMHTPFVQGGSK